MDRLTLERYSRQILVPEIGKEGQEKILNSRVLVVGCGALGTHISNYLIRAGVGTLTIIDPDFIEISNLQRQIMFTESEIGLPKAVAAMEYLKQVNSKADISAKVTFITPKNIEKYIQNIDLVMDATDNLETRFLLNDACLKFSVPWIYTGVIATYGMTMAIVPELDFPCFRCLNDASILKVDFSEDTCDVRGILAPTVSALTSFALIEALKILTENYKNLRKGLLIMDVFSGSMDIVNVEKDDDCLACSKKKYEFLEKKDWIIKRRNTC